MSGTLRALDFDGFAAVVEQAVDVFDESHYWHAGTVSPTQDWPELLETADAMVGLDHLSRAVAHGDDLDDQTLAELPDRFAAAVRLETDGEVKRYGDWQYPAWAFADPETTADLKRADAQFAGLTAFPASAVDQADHRLLSPGELLDRIDDVAAAYGDEYALLTGHFGPDDGFSVRDAGSVHRIGITQYPADIFADTGIGPIQQAKTPLTGALILRRNDLAARTLKLVDGEADQAGPDGVEQEAER
jgi:hypothetical protein